MAIYFHREGRFAYDAPGCARLPPDYEEPPSPTEVSSIGLAAVTSTLASILPEPGQESVPSSPVKVAPASGVANASSPTRQAWSVLPTDSNPSTPNEKTELIRQRENDESKAAYRSVHSSPAANHQNLFPTEAKPANVVRRALFGASAPESSAPDISSRSEAPHEETATLVQAREESSASASDSIESLALAVPSVAVPVPVVAAPSQAPQPAESMIANPNLVQLHKLVVSLAEFLLFGAICIGWDSVVAASYPSLPKCGQGALCLHWVDSICWSWVFLITLFVVRSQCV